MIKKLYLGKRGKTIRKKEPIMNTKGFSPERQNSLEKEENT